MSTVTTTTHRKVVAVGVDGSPQATAAARFAADFAARNAWDLWLISAYQVPAVPAAAYVASLHTSRTAAAVALQETLDLVRVAPHVHLRTLLQQGPVNAVLTEVCSEAQLLVLGQHHLAPIDRAREGNHTAAIVARATCPVTVVPANWDPHHTTLRPIIVALDGVSDAHAALTLAFDDAAARQASVVVMHVTTTQFDEIAAPTSSLTSQRSSRAPSRTIPTCRSGSGWWTALVGGPRSAGRGRLSRHGRRRRSVPSAAGE